ncbi:MAG TPA: hypothetical protein VGT41_06535 [Candidatus Babeliales bacterium]|nr:hypothetical protein [Candidatus Babeliales bacterium]
MKIVNGLYLLGLIVTSAAVHAESMSNAQKIALINACMKGKLEVVPDGSGALMYSHATHNEVKTVYSSKPTEIRDVLQRCDSFFERQIDDKGMFIDKGPFIEDGPDRLALGQAIGTWFNFRTNLDIAVPLVSSNRLIKDPAKKIAENRSNFFTAIYNAQDTHAIVDLSKRAFYFKNPALHRLQRLPINVRNWLKKK